MNRRDFIKLSAVSAGAMAMDKVSVFNIAEAKGVPKKKAVIDSEVKALVFNVNYTTQILTPPKEGGMVSLWIPLPQSDHEQEITRLSISSPQAFIINEEPVYGNKMVYVNSDKLKNGDSISISYKIRRKKTGTITDASEDTKRHLALTEREKWDNKITKFVDDVVGGERSPLEIGRKIYNALVDYLTYDKQIPGCGQGISTWTFEQRRGRCDDFHALFRTMMVYKGIPVRWEQGIPLPYPSAMSKEGKMEGDCTGAHCWVRFYIGNGQWLPVDVSEANKRKDLREFFFGTLSPNRFKISTGRGIILKPGQAGEPLNSLYFTHGEYNEMPLIYGHHYRNTIKYELVNMEV